MRNTDLEIPIIVKTKCRSWNS